MSDEEMLRILEAVKDSLIDGDKFNYDTLKDLGLCTDDYEVYGKIVNDEGWGNDYDPFYGRVKTILFYHDTDGKMVGSVMGANSGDSAYKELFEA